MILHNKNWKLLKYGVSLRLVFPYDADFIFSLRTDPRLNKYISATSLLVKDQMDWLIEYKKREEANEEFYFLVEDEVGNKLGVIRLYNFNEDRFEVGSWIFTFNSPAGASIKAYVLCLQIAFEILNYVVCFLSIRKEHKSVLKFHLLFGSKIISENQEYIYMELSKKSFYDKAAEILENVGSSLEFLNVQLEKSV